MSNSLEAQEVDYGGKQLSLLSSHAKLGTMPAYFGSTLDVFQSCGKSGRRASRVCCLGCNVKPKVYV